MPTPDFEKRYQEDADPWGYRESWYEQRKYAITLACLPREKYRLAWEPGCSIGVLTRMLATRCDSVHACDVSPTAITQARTDAPANITWSVQRIPTPSGLEDADLVVLSEILYYLNHSDRERVIGQAWDTLGPGGDLVVVHRRHTAEDTFSSGEQTHGWVRTQPGWRHLVTHEDEKFALDVLRRP